MIKYQAGGTGEFTKYSYDSLGQVTRAYVGYDTSAGENAYGAAGNDTGDTIFEQANYTYDANGNLTATARISGSRRRNQHRCAGRFQRCDYPLADQLHRLLVRRYWPSRSDGTTGLCPLRRCATARLRTCSDTIVNSSTVLINSISYGYGGTNSNQQQNDVTDPMGRVTGHALRQRRPRRPEQSRTTCRATPAASTATTRPRTSRPAMSMNCQRS